MKRMKGFAREEGVTSIEYALIAVFVSIVIITGATLIGANVQAMFGAAAGALGG